MEKMITVMTGKYKSSAKVVDGTLILSLPGALSPVVWRWDLGQAKASALEVTEKDGVFTLILKTPRGEVQEVAPFATRVKALEALMAVSKAMENAKGQIASSNAQSQNQTAALSDEQNSSHTGLSSNKALTEAVKWMIALFSVLAVIALFFYLSSITPDSALSPRQTASTNQTSNPQESTGVPVSADDFLGSF